MGGNRNKSDLDTNFRVMADVAVIVVIALAVLVFEIRFGIFKQVMFNTVVNGNEWLGEVFLICFVLVALLAFFALRRYRELREEMKQRRCAEKLLRASEERFRSLVMNLPGAVYRLCRCDDGQWEMDYISDAITEISGYPASDFIHNRVRTYRSIMHPDNCGSVEEFRAAGREIPDFCNREYRIITSGGQVKWVSGRGQAVYDEEGALVCYDGVITDITERKKAEEALLNQTRNLQAINKIAAAANKTGDFKNILRSLLESIKEVMGYRYGAVYLTDVRGQTASIACGSGLLPGQLDEAGYRTVNIGHERFRPLFYGGEVISGEHAIPGDEEKSDWIAVPLLAREKVIGALALSGNKENGLTQAETAMLAIIGREVGGIIYRKQASEALLSSEKRFRSLAENLPDGLYLLRPDFRPVYINPALAGICGCPPEYMINEPEAVITSLIHPDDRQKVIETFFSSPGAHLKAEMEHRIIRPDGDVRYLRNVMHCLADDEGRTEYYQGLVTDITDRKQTETRLKYISLHDPLTGLFNRLFFEQEMQRLENEGVAPVAVIACDVDGLKIVNDNMGHRAGDSLLMAFANLLRKCFRSGDVLARIGGDEFAVLLSGGSPSALGNAGDRLRQTIAYYNADNPPLPLMVSLGEALRVNCNVTMGALFKEADDHMYAEKRKNRHRVRRFLQQYDLQDVMPDTRFCCLPPPPPIKEPPEKN